LVALTAVGAVCVCLQAKRGKHSSKEVSVPRINDVSAPGQGARAKQYLPFLQRGGKLLGLVESVSSGEWRQSICIGLSSIWVIPVCSVFLRQCNSQCLLPSGNHSCWYLFGRSLALVVLHFACIINSMWSSSHNSYVYTSLSAGHRLKIHVPKEGVTIAMAPSGVRAPQRPMPAMGGRPAAAGEPYGLEAYMWTREHFNQREVGVAVCSCDQPDCLSNSCGARLLADWLPDGSGGWQLELFSEGHHMHQ
jgi:hypothetical protein